MAAPIYSTKVGDTFYAECTFEGSDGAPVSLDAAQIDVASSLLSPDESLGIAPIEALKAGRKAEVRRVAQSLAF